MARCHEKIKQWIFNSILALMLCSLLLVPVVNSGLVHAQINSCDANISPGSVQPGSDNYMVFGVSNPTDTAIQWLQITKPAGGYVAIESASAYRWQADTTIDKATFTQGYLAGNHSLNFSVQMAASNDTSSPVNWTVQVSDDPGGANPINCNGDLSMSIIPQPSVIIISNVSATNVSSSSITITWDTDIPSTSQVHYGPDGGYGQSSSLDPTLATSHSATLKGLSSNTAYHYQVESTTPDGGDATSGDNTFLSAIKETASPGPSSVQNSPAIGVAVTDPGDKTPPTIALNSVSGHQIYKTAPALSGTASDDRAVARVEYSIDGGKDWLPVDTTFGLGTKNVSYSFTPQNLDDGNYAVLARAIDGGGNITASSPLNIVIDRLPPLVGGDLIYIGPQILEPSQKGVIESVVGVDQKITLSAVGGPISINLNAVSKNSKTKAKDFTLTRSPDNGLWSGILGFEDPGTYTITANSVDGAGNKTSRELNDIQVSPAGKVINTKTKRPVTATISVYYLQPDSNNWVLWDGTPYGQTNPQKAGQDGQFNLFLPTGKYYLKASAKGYQNLHSDIFELKQSMPISTNLNIKPADLKLGPLNISWPDFSSQPISLATGSKDQNKNSLVGKALPEFKLGSTNGDEVNNVDLLGKPTVISLMSTWSPTTAEQLGALAKLQSNKDINVVPVGLQENAGKVRTYSEISGYKLDWLADPDSTLTGSFDIHSLPTHYFVDRKGVIKKVVSGLLTKTEISDNLSSL